MINWEAFHFLRPAWLLALVFVVFLLWLGIRRPAMSSAWRDVVDAHLLPFLLTGQHNKHRYVSVVTIALALTVAIIALAGPTWSRMPQIVYQAEVTRMIILDLSRSMDAADVKPSRLERAKFKTLDLLDNIREGQVGLVVFAAEPYVVSPLTEDSATIAAMVPALETRLMPAQGSRPDLALEKVDELFTQTATQQGDVIIITDGLGNSPALAKARQLMEKGHSVSVIGVGTAQGAPIPQRRGGFVKDSAGGIVIPVLDAASLQNLAASSNGMYSPLTLDDSDINAYLALADIRRKTQESESTQTTDQWHDQGVWLVFLILPLALLAFRREALSVAVVFILSMQVQEPAYAIDWPSLWLNQDQQADKAMQAGKYQDAYEQFSDPAWKGAASYRGGVYDKAIEQFSKLDGVEGQYNLGNALARAGKLEEAIAAYDRVLEQDNDHQDAGFNKSLLQKLLQQQQQQQQSRDNSGQGQSDKQESDSQQQGQNQSGSGDDSQESAQQHSDQARSQMAADNEQRNKENQGQRNDQVQQAQQGAEKRQETGQEKAEDAGSDAMASKRSDQDNESVEKRQATEQWLSRIKDDPGGLLRQKFIREHQRRRDSGSKSISGDQW